MSARNALVVCDEKFGLASHERDRCAPMRLPLGDIVSAQTAAVLGLPEFDKARARWHFCRAGLEHSLCMITRGLLCNGRMLCNGRCARRHRPTDRLLG